MRLTSIKYHYPILLLLSILFFTGSIWAEEETALPVLTKYDDDLSVPLLNTEHSQWFTIPYTFGYPPIISNDMNLSAYDWNAFDTEWINMRALAMVAGDWSQFHQSDGGILQAGDLSRYRRFDIRGIRLGAGGTINFDKPWTYLFSAAINAAQKDYDWSSGNWYTVFDALLGIPLWGEYGRIQIGKMKEPISMERSMGLVFEQVMERPMHLDAFLPSRDIGVTLSDMLLDGRVRWRAGFFNDWIDEPGLSFSQSDMVGVGRLTTVAYEEGERLLHLGVGYRYVSLKEGMGHYDVGPEQNFVPPWLDTGEFSAESSQTLNLELTWMDGPLWIASEYTTVWVDSEQYGDPTFRGYHISVNYFVTGEHRGYNHRTGTVRRIRPVLDFSEGGLGAVELSARYSYLDLNDAAIQGGEMSIVSAGFIWHPRYDLQFHAQWSHADLKSLDLSSHSIPMQSDTDILQFRIVFLLD
jgi:phosphate-selective porin OprO/OprP